MSGNQTRPKMLDQRTANRSQMRQIIANGNYTLAANIADILRHNNTILWLKHRTRLTTNHDASLQNTTFCPESHCYNGYKHIVQAINIMTTFAATCTNIRNTPTSYLIYRLQFTKLSITQAYCQI